MTNNMKNCVSRDVFIADDSFWTCLVPFCEKIVRYNFIEVITPAVIITREEVEAELRLALSAKFLRPAFVEHFNAIQRDQRYTYLYSISKNVVKDVVLTELKKNGLPTVGTSEDDDDEVNKIPDDTASDLDVRFHNEEVLKIFVKTLTPRELFAFAYCTILRFKPSEAADVLLADKFSMYTVLIAADTQVRELYGISLDLSLNFKGVSWFSRGRDRAQLARDIAAAKHSVARKIQGHLHVTDFQVTTHMEKRIV